MTKKALKKICIDHKGYGTPELNEKLYFHCRGFTKIENLEEYTGVKVLWLQQNAISKIEGISNCSLKSLFLQENLISEIEGLEALTELDSLHLGTNSIKRLQNLSHLKKLSGLNLSKCQLSDAKNLSHLLDLPMLQVLDLSQNKFEEPVELVENVKQLQTVKVLYLKGNPAVKKITNYRKTMISSMPSLTFLDDRPVFAEERRIAEAWAAGGRTAEQDERQRLKDEKAEEERQRFEDFEKFREGARLGNAVDNSDDSAQGDDCPAIEDIPARKEGYRPLIQVIEE